MSWSKAIWLLALLLAGCATAPVLPPPVDNPSAAWRARQIELQRVTRWKIQGRLALHTAEQGLQASLHWVRERERHILDLTGPLGRGHVRLSLDREGAQLRDADGKTYKAENAQQLLYRHTGWVVPLNELNYWILGLPAPDVSANQDMDEWGRLKTLRQSGWEIRFLEYTRTGALELPSKLFIKKQTDGADATELKNAALNLRLSIERWTLNERDP